MLDSFAEANLDLTVSNDELSASLFVQNLFDDRTIRSSAAFGDNFSFPQLPALGLAAYATDPRRVGVRLKARF